jgi:hypothetical protein
MPRLSLAPLLKGKRPRLSQLFMNLMTENPKTHEKKTHIALFPQIMTCTMHFRSACA